MKIYELIERLYSDGSEEEVYIMDDDGTLWDIVPEHVDESFDGFETAYPAAVGLKRKRE